MAIRPRFGGTIAIVPYTISLINRRPRPPFADDIRLQGIPGGTADDAVRHKPLALLITADRLSGCRAKYAVQTARAAGKGVQAILQNQHISTSAPLPQQGISAAAAGGRELPSVKVHPGRCSKWE